MGHFDAERGSKRVRWLGLDFVSLYRYYRTGYTRHKAFTDQTIIGKRIYNKKVSKANKSRSCFGTTYHHELISLLSSSDANQKNSC